MVKYLLIALAATLLLWLSDRGGVTADPVPPPRLPICGDQDASETPFRMSCPDLTQLPDVQTFTVSGSGDVQITFDAVYRKTSFNNELGYFLVDDPDGSIGGLRPGDPGYFSAIYQRAEIIFASGSDSSTADAVKSVPGGSVLLFFLVSNATLVDLEADNPDNRTSEAPLAFFSWDALNPDATDHFIGYQHEADDYIQFGFEDLSTGGDLDYDDVVYNVSTAETGAVIAPTTDDGGGSGLILAGLAVLAAGALGVGGGVFLWRRRGQQQAAEDFAVPTGRAKQRPIFLPTGPLEETVLGDAWLEVMAPTGGERVPLGEDPVTIGFTEDCTITLPGDSGRNLARARVWRREGRYMLHNLSRVAPVSVGGRTVSAQVILEEGDVIEIGASRILFRAGKP